MVLFCISLIQISCIFKGVLFCSGETFTLVTNEICNSHFSTHDFHPLPLSFHLCIKDMVFKIHTFLCNSILCIQKNKTMSTFEKCFEN